MNWHRRITSDTDAVTIEVVDQDGFVMRSKGPRNDWIRAGHIWREMYWLELTMKLATLREKVG